MCPVRGRRPHPPRGTRPARPRARQSPREGVGGAGPAWLRPTPSRARAAPRTPSPPPTHTPTRELLPQPGSFFRSCRHHRSCRWRLAHCCCLCRHRLGPASTAVCLRACAPPARRVAAGARTGPRTRKLRARATTRANTRARTTTCVDAPARTRVAARQSRASMRTRLAHRPVRRRRRRAGHARERDCRQAQVRSKACKAGHGRRIDRGRQRARESCRCGRVRVRAICTRVGMRGLGRVVGAGAGGRDTCDALQADKRGRAWDAGHVRLWPGRSGAAQTEHG